MLQIAMLSFWHVHAEEYANTVNRSGIAKVAAVWDEVPSRGWEWAEKLNARFVNNLEKVLADPGIDGVLICSPTSMHKEIMVKAARAGKHIFTEKVMALTEADALEIASAVRESGVVFSISYPHRTMACNLFAKRALDSGLIGRPTLLRFRNAHDGSVAGWLPPHFYNKEQCGGGAMIDLGAHGMYLAAWLLGEPKSIQSTFTNVLPAEVEDNAVSVIAFQNGAIAINETGFVTPRSPVSLELYGTEGSLLIRDGEVVVNAPKAENSLVGSIKVSSLPDPLPGAIPSWLQEIAGTGKALFTLEDAITLTKLMDGAYRSHREGKKVFF